MQEQGLAPPVVAERQGAVVITFMLPALAKTPQKTPDAIVNLLGAQPELSFAEIAAILGKSESAIKRAIRKLRELGRLARIGPKKGGRWRVIK
mgnify:CR=1 FL=1